MGQEREIRLQIMIREEELAVIEEWRFAKRMPSRAAALRELMRRGLAADGFDLAEPGKRSAQYGVTEKLPIKGNGKHRLQQE